MGGSEQNESATTTSTSLTMAERLEILSNMSKWDWFIWLFWCNCTTALPSDERIVTTVGALKAKKVPGFNLRDSWRLVPDGDRKEGTVIPYTCTKCSTAIHTGCDTDKVCVFKTCAHMFHGSGLFYRKPCLASVVLYKDIETPTTDQQRRIQEVQSLCPECHGHRRQMVHDALYYEGVVDVGSGVNFPICLKKLAVVTLLLMVPWAFILPFSEYPALIPLSVVVFTILLIAWLIWITCSQCARTAIYHASRSLFRDAENAKRVRIRTLEEADKLQ